MKAKMEGRKIAPPKAPEPTTPANLMEALRQSVGEIGENTKKAKRAARKPAAAKPTTKKRKRAA